VVDGGGLHWPSRDVPRSQKYVVEREDVEGTELVVVVVFVKGAAKAPVARAAMRKEIERCMTENCLIYIVLNGMREMLT